MTAPNVHWNCQTNKVINRVEGEEGIDKDIPVFVYESFVLCLNRRIEGPGRYICTCSVCVYYSNILAFIFL